MIANCAVPMAPKRDSMQTYRYLKAIVVLSALFAVACGSSSPTDGAAGSSAIKVVSNRADLLSGGDVLIDIVPPAGVDRTAATVALNNQDVTGAFSPMPDGTLRGLITGLALGDNTVTLRYPGGAGSVQLRNHANGGPVIAGPQLQPWTCQEGADDAQCNQAPVYAYFYQSTRAQGLQPYDPANPPTDVAETTTDEGVAVPFIVRQETGYQDRDQYQIAVLYQPDQPWSAAQPQAQFNHKLLVTHGVGCGVSYVAGTAPSVLSYAQGFGSDVSDSALYALGAGFAVMSTALANSGHNCNLALQAESLIMAKEHLIEQYGTLRYTIGVGCSGGSLTAQQIANAYPGIYQGVLPTCSLPDIWSTATQFADYHLLVNYFGDRSKWGDGVYWTGADQAKVMGRVLLTLNATVSDAAQWQHVAVPTDPCEGTTDENRYDPVNNPGGVRCTVTDATINVLGPRPSELWTDNEKTIGRGYAGFPVDNIGVQYGLATLQKGDITLAQFLDVNVKIGGLDVDANFTAGRTAAVEPALSNAYRSGSINETNNLDQTAIIDCRGPDPGSFHDPYRSFAIRARLDREHGSHDNQLIWEGPMPLVGYTACNQESLLAMDRWLAAVEQDLSDKPLAQKIVADKPADLGDQCWSSIGRKLSDGLCNEWIVPVLGTPRTVAGDAISTDVNKCQLKPLNRDDDYGATPFTDEQWAQMQALFPDGVCDFSKPGVSQQPTVPWQTYQTAEGEVIYGGTALPARPAGVAMGWTSPAFRNAP